MKKLYLLLFVLMTAVGVKAQWVEDPSINTMLAHGSADYGEIYLSTHKESGNIFIQWSSMKSNGWSPSIQMVSHEGVPQWGDNGIDIMGQNFSSYSNGIAMASIGDGGVISIFANETGECIMVKINPDGSFPWGEAGMTALQMDNTTRTEIAAGNDGGFWAMAFNDNNTYLRYYNGDGTPFGEQITISNDNGYKISFSQLVLDENNNAFVVYEKERWAYTYYYYKNICVAKYAPDGTQLTQETLLMSEQAIGGYISHNAIADGLGGGYAWISHPVNNDCFEVYTFHFDENGENTFGNTTGIIINQVDGQNYHLEPQADVDPISHDLIVSFIETDAATQSQKALLVNRITPTGEKPWGEVGFTMVPTTGINLGTVSLNAFPKGNGAGAAIVYGMGGFNDSQIMAFGIDDEGTVIWDAAICSYPTEIAICENTNGFQNGQLIVVWQDGRNQTSLYGQNLKPDGTLGPVEMPEPCYAPTNFAGEYVFDAMTQTFGVQLSWDAPQTTPLHYNLYVIKPDGCETTIEVAPTETSYYDEMTIIGDVTYQLTAVYEECESDYALTENGENYVSLFVTGITENEEHSFNVHQDGTQLIVNGKDIQKVEIINMAGQHMTAQNVNQGSASLNVSGYAQGLYLVKATDSRKNTKVQKVVIR